jgi:hypothetical protein
MIDSFLHVFKGFSPAEYMPLSDWQIIGDFQHFTTQQAMGQKEGAIKMGTQPEDLRHIYIILLADSIICQELIYGSEQLQKLNPPRGRPRGGFTVKMIVDF